MEPICMQYFYGTYMYGNYHKPYLWVVRKNLTSIMKVLLVGFCGL